MADHTQALPLAGQPQLFTRKPSNLYQDGWNRLLKNRGAVGGMIVVGFFALVAILAPVLAPHNALAIYPNNSYRPPMWVQSDDPTHSGLAEFPLGTDTIERDVLSRAIYGTRTSLIVGFIPMLLIITIGTVVGLIAGCARRITLARGARYFVDGVVQGTDDSLVVALRVYDAAADSLLTRASARGARGSVPAYQLALMATTRLLPAVLGSVPGVDATPLLASSPAGVALFIQGERAYRKADFRTALDFYQRAVAEDSLLVPAAMKGAQAAGWEHRTMDAEVLIGTAVRHDSLMPPRHRLLARGLASYFAGDADSAMLRLGEAIAADSAWAEAHLVLGEVAQHLMPRDRDSLPALAVREFRAVLEVDSAFAPALYHLGMTE